MKLKYIVLYASLLLAFSSCGERSKVDNPNHVNCGNNSACIPSEAETTAQVLNVISGVDYISRGNSLQVSSDGLFGLQYDAAVRYFFKTPSETAFLQTSARCILKYSGSVKFSTGGDSTTARLTKATMEISGLVVISSAATAQTTSDFSANFICESYAREVLAKKTFINYLVEYSPEVVNLSGLSFGIENQNRGDSGTGHIYDIKPYSKILGNGYDIQKAAGVYFYFLKPGKTIDLTETALKDLAGELVDTTNYFTQDGTAISETIMVVDAVNKQLVVKNESCKLNYQFSVSAIKIHREGLKPVLSGRLTSQPGALSPACTTINEKIQKLNSPHLKMFYASGIEQRDPNKNYIQFYLESTQASEELFRFFSKQTF